MGTIENRPLIIGRVVSKQILGADINTTQYHGGSHDDSKKVIFQPKQHVMWQLRDKHEVREIGMKNYHQDCNVDVKQLYILYEYYICKYMYMYIYINIMYMLYVYT